MPLSPIVVKAIKAIDLLCCICFKISMIEINNLTATANIEHYQQIWQTKQTIITQRKNCQLGKILI